MIFVTLGTREMPFTRPIKEIEQCVKDGLISEPVVVQSGNTSYSSSLIEVVPFYAPDELERMYDQASTVICQAGIGAIMLGLRKRKNVLAVARRAKYGEHVDDHQLEILEVFRKAGAILPWDAEGDLPDVLRRLEGFVPVAYEFAPEKISAAILGFLNGAVRA